MLDSLRKKYPSVDQFIRKRLRREDFSGLRLTIFIVLMFFITTFLWSIVEGVLSHERIVTLDSTLANWLHEARTPFVTKFFLAVTQMGSVKFIATLSAIVIGTLIGIKKYHYITTFVLVNGATALSVYLGKMILQRPRPAGLIPVYIEPSFSLPSGHAASSIAVYGFLIYVFVKLEKSQLVHIFGIVGGIVLILLIGFSRLYLGVHFLSDVLGGYLVGGLWLLVSIMLVEWWELRREFVSKKKT